MITSIRTIGAYLFSMLFLLPAMGMDLARVEDTIFATGRVDTTTFTRFKDEFAKGEVKKIVFYNSPGGDGWTALTIGRFIRDKKISTRISGFCFSACSIMFMGGVDRRFSTGVAPSATMIGIHGGADLIFGSLMPQANPPIYAFYRESMGEKFNNQIISESLYRMNDAGALLRVREFERNQSDQREPWFCPSRSTPRSQCTQYANQDAFTLGIITSTQTDVVKVPSLLKSIHIFGIKLNSVVDHDLNPTPVESEIKRHCRENTNCLSNEMSNYQLWKGKSSHKAAAISLDGSYAAWSDSSLDPLTAARIALYRCNHSGGFSRLCKLLVIDDVLIPNLDDTAKTESNEILNQLRNNKPRLQPDEVTPGSRNVNAMKTDGFVGLTPQSLSGIPSINSSELLNALLSDTPPLIIDVSATGSRMIPTSIHLLLGGLAFKDQALDFQYDLRFKGILRALGANNERIIIFYTDSDSNWFAANAALRAKAAGYQDVRWYRAGLEAWTRNQLRTIQKFPNAVMN